MDLFEGKIASWYSELEKDPTATKSVLESMCQFIEYKYPFKHKDITSIDIRQWLLSVYLKCDNWKKGEDYIGNFGINLQNYLDSISLEGSFPTSFAKI